MASVSRDGSRRGPTPKRPPKLKLASYASVAKAQGLSVLDPVTVANIEKARAVLAGGAGK